MRFLLALVAAGCTPLHHSIEPYASDPAQAADVETRASAYCAALRPGGTLPPHSFTTDGCSMFPDSDWVQCCVEHDFAYWCGGSASQREEVDRALQDCVAGLGQAQTAWWMHKAVRAGGHPWWPLPWRWGYGWPWPRGYEQSP
ncbi:MAG: hypothetical protein ACT4P3_17735 [Betaproteobacteria bacterium]